MTPSLYTVGYAKSYDPHLGAQDFIKCKGGVAFHTPEEARAWINAEAPTRFGGKAGHEFGVYEIEDVPITPWEGVHTTTQQSRILRRLAE